MTPDRHLLAWNLGLIEFLYLVPVNALILFLAFRSKKRVNAGLITVLTGVLYAPVRFGLDFLRPEETDPRYLGLTFAQWASFLAFGAAVYVATRIFRNGGAAETVTVTSGEAQRKLKLILKDDSEPASKAKKAEKAEKKAPLPAAKASVRDDNDDSDDNDEVSESDDDNDGGDAKGNDRDDGDEGDDGDDDDGSEDRAAATKKASAGKPSGTAKAAVGRGPNQGKGKKNKRR